jgi:hypothetical protein
MTTRDTRPLRSPRREDATAGQAERKPDPSAEWRLPSGQSLAEFALASGLLAREASEPVRNSARRRAPAKG